jgi:outer membrane immunogenic protein
MKRVLIVGAFALLAGGQALAADLPPPVAPPPRAPAVYVPVAQVFSWTGIYVGVNGGGDFGTVTPGAALGGAAFNTTGFLIGGTLGGNYQMGSFVIGLEGDGDYNSLNTTIPGGGTFTSQWLATVRGRAGWAWDRILFFGTGGAAFAPAAVTGLNSTTMTGWTAGGGIEYAFTPNWTAKAEYLYVDFPSPSFTAGSFKDTENVIRAGINYKFW